AANCVAPPLRLGEDFGRDEDLPQDGLDDLVAWSRNERGIPERWYRNGCGPHGGECPVQEGWILTDYKGYQSLQTRQSHHSLILCFPCTKSIQSTPFWESYARSRSSPGGITCLRTYSTCARPPRNSAFTRTPSATGRRAASFEACGCLGR